MQFDSVRSLLTVAAAYSRKPKSTAHACAHVSTFAERAVRTPRKDIPATVPCRVRAELSKIAISWILVVPTRTGFAQPLHQ